MRISDWSSDVCSSDLGGERGRAGPAVALPMKPYPLRVADRGRPALAPESAHLGPIVQMGVGDDRPRGLDDLPMPEHIGPRSRRRGGEASERLLHAPYNGAETPPPFPVARARMSPASHNTAVR